VIQTSFFVTQTDSDDIGVYDFSAPIDLRIWELQDPFFMELISTEAFQRLHSVRFLGGIDYSLVQSPNGAWGNIRYTRFQHSLGVARLSLMYGRACELSKSDTRLIFSAALLHDVGHAPL
jgi:HD superfamily phosphohydrolase